MTSSLLSIKSCLTCRKSQNDSPRIVSQVESVNSLCGSNDLCYSQGRLNWLTGQSISAQGLSFVSQLDSGLDMTEGWKPNTCIVWGHYTPSTDALILYKSCLLVIKTCTVNIAFSKSLWSTYELQSNLATVVTTGSIERTSKQRNTIGEYDFCRQVAASTGLTVLVQSTNWISISVQLSVFTPDLLPITVVTMSSLHRKHCLLPSIHCDPVYPLQVIAPTYTRCKMIKRLTGVPACLEAHIQLMILTFAKMHMQNINDLYRGCRCTDMQVHPATIVHAYCTWNLQVLLTTCLIFLQPCCADEKPFCDGNWA